ncbi:hypothetical protein BS47DRAFT_1358066 [Hydnum rufescens UP504]|uniref:Uncharacterized protein n=1 Tax=Hydnum rufescens UP504 TaxID=1448309 RepID=A0A9P6B9I5_9AGAM|nr:hypothetical protein BS47DRAFT_1358066 [Hydnum rufescens UP504]
MAHPIDRRRRNVKNIFMGSIGQRGMSDLDHPMGSKGMTRLAENEERSSYSRHTGRIELLGPNPTRDCPRVGIEIVEEALPAVGKAVGALKMKVKMGVQIPGPKMTTTETPPSSKWVRRIHEPFPVRQELSSHTRDAGARLLERNRGDAVGQYHPKWANNNPLASKILKKSPLLNQNGQAQTALCFKNVRAN